MAFYVLPLPYSARIWSWLEASKLRMKARHACKRWVANGGPKLTSVAEKQIFCYFGLARHWHGYVASSKMASVKKAHVCSGHVQTIFTDWGKREGKQRVLLIANNRLGACAAITCQQSQFATSKEAPTNAATPCLSEHSTLWQLSESKLHPCAAPRQPSSAPHLQRPCLQS